MAKREINVFNISFLDLLSGALGAVLILFIIVPKLTSDIERQLQELEQIKELKIDVAKIENMMDKLRQSVPKQVLSKVEKQINNLDTQIKKLQKTTEDLALEVKNLQNKLAKCDEQRENAQKKIKELQQKIKDLENRMKNSDSIIAQLKKEIEDQKKRHEKEIQEVKQKLADSEKEKARLQKELEQMQPRITELEVQKEALEKEIVEVTKKKNEEIAKIKKQKEEEITQIKRELEKAKEESRRQAEKLAQFEEKAGLTFQDKNIVFIVDQSTSMRDNQKMDEVKAGLKMMIATMDDSYKVDIVVFPKSKDERYGYKYGSLKPVTENTKYDLYNYISNLKAYGCTPTKEVMDFVLTSSSYSGAGTITLLSDGLPTIRTTDTKCDEVTSTGEIESFIKSKSGGKTINCIGVGKEFRTKSSSDLKVRFMQNVAKQNGGFYIGF